MLLLWAFLTNALADHAVQVFGLFRDFGGRVDRRPKEKERETSGAGELFPVLILPLLLRT